ncbi:MAG TPA: serine hydrolase domain-containing protein [Ideonella sp.]|uniref:serine hydrolase domain-containing protein n=1 Tax=Ideonella sp. TaxID=1929293 RepID=UPI002C2A3DA8|nr:serine hydrolase domain-containing protein [Ideonella sp.]HSI48814.1 serine hydrolase domain-containing protein [Ideonella sp.]
MGRARTRKIGQLAMAAGLLLGIVGAGLPQSAMAQAAASALAADTPSTTTRGNRFLAPQGWKLSVRGGATLLEAPEGGSFVMLMDVTNAADSDAAVAAAWAAYKGSAPWPLRLASPVAAKDGWTERRSLVYQTSPNEERGVSALVQRANGVWTVVLEDIANAVGEKRGAQLSQIFGKLLPKGYERETFAGKKAQPLTPERMAMLSQFVQQAMAETQVPGVAFGLVQDGKLVFAGGLGVRALGQPEKVDADTRFQIASNTKAMTTLMLAKLVDQQKMGWNTPAAQLLPSFKLGSPETTRQVLVKHLICACTGMPRQDLEWLLEFRDLTPEGAMKLLGTMQPTSGFGELFQYSNPMAAAAGYIGGHVAYPALPIGQAYDQAMQALVFDPLGMRRTTLDYAAAQVGNTAMPHAPNEDGSMVAAERRMNLSIVPMRPAGAGWSTVNDVLKYVSMELAEGKLPDGKTYVSREPLLARRAPQVTVSTDLTYGMGLEVNTVYGTPVVHHGGDMIGYHSDMMWLPEHGVGAVVLTNGDLGWMIRSQFRRKLLEVLFDGKPEADAAVAAQAKAYYGDLAVERKLLTVPADPAVAAKLAKRYVNAAVGAVEVSRIGNRLHFDFGEFDSDMATRRNPDGTITLSTLVPGFSGMEFVVGQQGDKRTLTLRDAQHEYVLLEQ